MQKVGKEPVAMKKVKQTAGLPIHKLGARAIGEHVSGEFGADDEDKIERVTVVSDFMS